MRVLVVVMCLAAGGAWGMTADGVLVTNMATGTYGSIDQTAYEVSYGATALVLVVAPSITVRKGSDVTAMCPGETVKFCIWAINNSALGSAFNVYVWDSVIPYAAYVQGQETWIEGGGVLTTGYIYGSVPVITSWLGEPNEGAYKESGTFILRWRIDVLGPAKSAMFCFRMVLL